MAKIKIVATADTHMAHERLRVPPGDIFVLAGDMTNWGTWAEGQAVVEWIAALPHEHKVVIAGNHDEWCQRESLGVFRTELFARHGIHYLCDSEVTVAGVRIYGSPWTPRFGDWSFMRSRGADIAERWALIPAGLDVLVTHGPALGFGDHTSPLRGTPERVGCAVLARAIARVRPRHHLCGHIHEDPGTWLDEVTGTRHWNVTSSSCRRDPVVIAIDVPHEEPVSERRAL